MKIKHIIYPLVAIASICPVFAQSKASNFNLVYWMGIHQQPAVVAQYELGTLLNVFGKKNWTLQVNTFGGVLSNGAPIAGFDVGKSIPLAQNVSLFIGIGASLTQGKPTNGGLVIGGSVNL